MKPTKHATTNFRMLKPFLDGLGEGTYRKYLSGEYMPLSVDFLYDSDDGCKVYAIAHYGEMNGDLMADPDMELKVDHAAGTVEPLTFQNDYMHMFQQVYVTRNGQKLYSKRLRTELDDFLWHWLRNIQDQGFAKNI